MSRPITLHMWLAHGLPCLISGTASWEGLCGYVCLPSTHPWTAARDVTDVAAMERPDVHGGITYWGPLRRTGTMAIGFDTMHRGDDDALEERDDAGAALPSMPDGHAHPLRRWDGARVRAETERLAAQAAAAGPVALTPADLVALLTQRDRAVRLFAQTALVAQDGRTTDPVTPPPAAAAARRR
jgi:hypothetical protein